MKYKSDEQKWRSTEMKLKLKTGKYASLATNFDFLEQFAKLLCAVLVNFSKNHWSIQWL